MITLLQYYITMESQTKYVGQVTEASMKIPQSQDSDCTGFLLVNRRINSETAKECEEVLYAFPSDLLTNKGLLVQMRGVFITFASLLRDTLTRNKSDSSSTEWNFFCVQLLADNSPTTVGVLNISTDHLFVLALPSHYLPGKEVAMEIVCRGFLNFLTFYVGDLLKAVNSPLLSELVSKFFEFSTHDWPRTFILPPQRVPLLLEDEVTLQDALLPLEAGIGLIPEKEEEGKHRRRQGFLTGCALLVEDRYLINHMPVDVLDQVCRLCRLYKSNNSDNHQIIVRWYPIFPISPTGILKGILMLTEDRLSLVMCLTSRHNLSEPPFSYVAAGRSRLVELKTLYLNRTPISDLLTMANPNDCFETAVQKAIEKEESRYNLQWLKSQMSPRSIRKTSSLSGSLTMLGSIDGGNCVTTFGKLIFTFIYIGSGRLGMCAFPKDWNISFDQTKLLEILRRVFQTCLEGLDWEDEDAVEQFVHFTIDKGNVSQKANKDNVGQLSLVIAKRKEHSGEEAIVCYHAGCPQNAKEMLDKLARQTTLRYGTSQLVN